MTVNLAVVYYSSTGTVHAMAERLAAAGEKAGAQVRLRQVAELAPAEAIVASQLKQFLDTLGPQWQQGLLADKVYAGFTASQTQHGGQESTLLAFYNTVHHFGGILVAPGYTDQTKFADGNPYGASHVTGAQNSDPLTEVDLAALDHLAGRVVTVAQRLAQGTQAA